MPLTGSDCHCKCLTPLWKGSLQKETSFKEHDPFFSNQKHWIYCSVQSDQAQANFLQLNKDKSEGILYSAEEERLIVRAQLQSVMLNTTNRARNLGVVIDSDMHFNSHIKRKTKSAYDHLKNISRIKGLMSQQVLEKLVHALILS